MEPEIETLLSEVPEGFTPTFEAKQEGERVVGQLADLDADTQRIVIGVFYFLEQYDALSAAHKLEHEQEGFVPHGEACRNAHGTLTAFREKVLAIREAAGRTPFEAFAFQPGESIDFRTEGVVAKPPQDPLTAMLQQLAASGVQVIVGGPEGLTEVTPTGTKPVPRGQ